MKNKFKMNLSMFNDRDFFTQAFEEAYPITQAEEEVPPIDETPIEEETPIEPEQEPTNEPQTLSDDEIKRLYEEKFGTPQSTQNVKHEETHEVDEETQSALDLYKYLQSNPHLVQAMKDVDVEGYQNLNNFVPDEMTKRINELEDYIDEQRYEKYIDGLKRKYEDFDENKVLEYAEENDVTNLEVAYKALKAESVKEPDVEEIRKQIKAELLEELKNNSINTQSIVGGISQKPITNDNEVSLSAREQRIAKAMGVSFADYAKWR